jgi:hypothetical protein
MIDREYSCSICNLEVSAKGCICDGAIKLIGIQCLADHIGDADGDHNIVDLNLALRMQSDKSLIDFYLSELPKMHEALSSLRASSTKIKELKRYLNEDKQKLLYKIEEILTQKATPIDAKEIEVNNMIKLINKYKNNLCGEGRELIESYRSQGLAGILSNNLKRIDIPIEDITYYISNSIHAIYSSDDIESETKGYTLTNKRHLIDVVKKEVIDEQQSISSHTEYSTASTTQILDKNVLIHELESAVNEQDIEIRKLNKQIEAHLKTISELMQKSTRKDEDTRDRVSGKTNKAGEMEELRIKLRENEYKLDEMKKYNDQAQSSLKNRNTLSQRMARLIKDLKKTENSIQSGIKVFNKYIRLDNAKSEAVSAIRNADSNIEKLMKKNAHHLNKLEEISRKWQDDLNTELNISFSGKRYIYVPNNDFKNIIQFDIHTEKPNIIEIPSLIRNFSDTSSCELPNGNIFIAGFNDPVSGEVFLYKIAAKECITLPSLTYPRYFLSLYYYRNYVYAFGGKNSKYAERYSLSNNNWETLPNMRSEGGCLSCVGVDNKIYLFYGGSQNIEVFNTITLRFEEFKLDNSDLNGSNCGIACRVDYRVYLITDHLTQVYDTSFNKLAQYSNIYKHKHYSIHNQIHYKECIYYFNYNTFNLEKIDTSFNPLVPQPSITPNRHIYNLRINTKFIHRVDLEYSTIETIDLSTRINRNFKCSSVCILDTGEIVIAGFYNPVCAESYIYSPATNICTRLPDLNIPRYFTTLIYHHNHVFAFGGQDISDKLMKGAEKINMTSRFSWDILPDMKHSRHLPACVAVDNKIYIMAGGVYHIEIFNIDSNTYIVSEFLLKSYNVVSAIHDDKIHIIGNKNYSILNKGLELLSDYQNKWRSDDNTYTLGDVCCYKDRIYFFNNSRDLLERVNITSLERKFQVLAHRVTHS